MWYVPMIANGVGHISSRDSSLTTLAVISQLPLNVSPFMGAGGISSPQWVYGSAYEVDAPRELLKSSGSWNDGV